MKYSFSNLKIVISDIKVKAEPIIDGDGDGKYTSDPKLGDVTPVPSEQQSQA